jgi:hypothetical protein
LADQLSWTPQKISKIQLGRQLPTRHEIDEWLDVCAATTELADLIALLEEAQALHTSWRGRGTQEEIQRSYGDLVASSTQIDLFEHSVVPGLVQTADYARAILRSWASRHDLGVSDTRIEEGVAQRIERQRHLYDTTRSGRRIRILVLETVLDDHSGMADEVVAGQMDRLLSVIGVPAVTLGILPVMTDLDIRADRTVGFGIYDELVIIEGPSGEIHLDAPDEVRAYREAFERMLSVATVGDEARRAISARLCHS